MVYFNKIRSRIQTRDQWFTSMISYTLNGYIWGKDEKGIK